MKCPHDGQGLVFVDDGTHLRDRCPRCEGVLLDRDEVVAALGRQAGRGIALTPRQVAALPQARLACPRDGKPMRVLSHRGVELDLCESCSSLWLDAGEIERARAKGPSKGSVRKGALAGAAVAAAGVGIAAAAGTDRQSPASGLAEAVGEVAAEGAIDLVFEFAVEAIGAIFS